MEGFQRHALSGFASVVVLEAGVVLEATLLALFAAVGLMSQVPTEG